METATHAQKGATIKGHTPQKGYNSCLRTPRPSEPGCFTVPSTVSNSLAQKKPKRPSTDEWISKIQPDHTAEYDSAKKEKKKKMQGLLGGSVG